MKECPTCPEPTDWSECTNGTQTRTNYRCSAGTNYTCESYQEEQSCETEKGPTGIPWLTVAAVVLLIVLGTTAGLVYYFKFHQSEMSYSYDEPQ